MPAKTQSPDTDQRKRSCLMCGTKFKSTWAGERICPRCRSSNAWKQPGIVTRGPRQNA